MGENYKIAGIKIGIDSDIKYNEKESFYNFKNHKDSDNDIEIKINLVEKNNLDTGNKIYDDIFNKIYKKDDVLYREFHSAGDKNPASCFVEKKQDDGKYYCYLYKSKKVNYDTYNIFSMIGVEYLLNQKRAIILHSSQISYKGKSILFTAPSQTGKSTQADLWKKYEGAEIINGDRSAIRKVDGEWMSYGLPYAGSSRIYKNIGSPIRAIIIIRQGKSNEIKRLSKLETFKYIYSETTVNIWDQEYISRTSDIIEELINEVPVYLYYCLPDKSAVDKLKWVLEESI